MTLVCIMTHLQSQDLFDRHLGLWEAHCCPLVVFCPADAVVNPRGHHVWAYGTRSHHDAMANRRFKEMLNMLTWTQFDSFWIFEGDALCLAPCLPFADNHLAVLGANCFYDDRPDKPFEGSLFTHPPLYLSRAGLDAVLPHLNALPDEVNGGFWDRAYGLAIERAGITPFDFLKAGKGFARNTVELHDYKAAYEAAAAGAVMFHGIKSEQALRVIRQGHEDAKANGKLCHGLEIPL